MSSETRLTGDRPPGEVPSLYDSKVFDESTANAVSRFPPLSRRRRITRSARTRVLAKTHAGCRPTAVVRCNKLRPDYSTRFDRAGDTIVKRIPVPHAAVYTAV